MPSTAPATAKDPNPLKALRVAVGALVAGSAALAVVGGGLASAALLISAVLSLVTVVPRISTGPGRISAMTLGGAGGAWFLGVALTLTGYHSTLWAVLVLLVAALAAVLVAIGVRALGRPATCAPSREVTRALEMLPGLALDTPVGAGGTVLAMDARGPMVYLVGQVSGDGDTFEDSLAYQEFTAILTRVRKSLKLDSAQLRGVVIIPELDRFGPLHVKGADEIVACSKSQMRKALTKRLRGH